MDKYVVFKKTFDVSDIEVLGSTDNLLDKIIDQWIEEREKEYFERLKTTEQISEAVLVMNPKHKGQMGEFLYVSGLKVPVIYGKYVEEDKAYMITDKELAKNVRDAYDNQRLE